MSVPSTYIIHCGLHQTSKDEKRELENKLPTGL